MNQSLYFLCQKSDVAEKCVCQKTRSRTKLGNGRKNIQIDTTSYTRTHDVQSDLSYPGQGVNKTRKPHIEAMEGLG